MDAVTAAAMTGEFDAVFGVEPKRNLLRGLDYVAAALQ
jgi:hypothetical protein